MFFVFCLLLLPMPFVISWFLAAAIHEMGHIICLCYFDVQIFQIILKASGMIIETETMEPKKEILCALVGPVVGSLGILLYPVNPYLAVFAFLQTVFNLLPVYPADGGRVLIALLSLKFSRRTVMLISKGIYITIFFVLVCVCISVLRDVEYDRFTTGFVVFAMLVFIYKIVLQCNKKNSTM